MKSKTNLLEEPEWFFCLERSSGQDEESVLGSIEELRVNLSKMEIAPGSFVFKLRAVGHPVGYL